MLCDVVDEIAPELDQLEHVCYMRRASGYDMMRL